MSEFRLAAFRPKPGSRRRVSPTPRPNGRQRSKCHRSGVVLLRLYLLVKLTGTKHHPTLL